MDEKGKKAIKHSDLNEELEKAPAPSNRRKYARRMARWNVTLLTAEKKAIKAVTRDVSEKGAAVLSPIQFPANTLLVAQIQAFYNGKPHEIRALSIVKHSSMTTDGFTIGLYFKDCTDASSIFLKKYSNNQI